MFISFYTQWLEEEFLPYLDKWEKSVEGRQDCSDADKKRMLLSAETRLGLRMTGMFLALVISHYSLFIASESH